MCATYLVEGEFEVGPIGAALTTLGCLHDALRMPFRYTRTTGCGRSAACKDAGWPLQEISLMDYDATTRDEEAQ